MKALAEYRDPTASPIFVKGLTSEDWLLREESIKGLLMIDDILIQQVSIPYILKALRDQRINVRLSALKYVKVRNIKIYEVLQHIVNNKNNYNRIIILISTLNAIKGYLLDDKTRERLIEFLTHPNREIRILSLSVLKKDNELKQIQEDS